MTAPDRGLCDQAYDLVCDMETDLSLAERFALAITMLAETIGAEDGLVFQAVAGEIIDRCRKVEERRGQLFHLLHPNRDHFEQVGGPGGDQAKEAAP